MLYWVFHGISAHALSNALISASWPALVLGAAINLGHNVFRVLRWRWLLDPVRKSVPMRPMFVAVILGYMTSFVGGRVGEVVRPALLSAREGLPLGPCLGTVVADRLLDGAAFVALFAVGSMSAHFTVGSADLAGKIRWTAVLALVAIVVGLIVLVAISTIGERLNFWLSRRWRVVRWAGHAALGLSRGADALRSPRRLVPIVAHSLLAWATIGIGTWIGIRAAGADVGFADVLVMLPLLAVGVSVPTPGGVGGYHVAMQFGLTKLFGVDPTIAASAGILMYLAIWIPILLLGSIMLFTERVSWSDLVAAAKQVRALGSAEGAVGAAR